MPLYFHWDSILLSAGHAQDTSVVQSRYTTITVIEILSLFLKGGVGVVGDPALRSAQKLCVRCGYVSGSDVEWSCLQQALPPVLTILCCRVGDVSCLGSCAVIFIRVEYLWLLDCLTLKMNVSVFRWTGRTVPQDILQHIREEGCKIPHIIVIVRPILVLFSCLRTCYCNASSVNVEIFVDVFMVAMNVNEIFACLGYYAV